MLIDGRIESKRESGEEDEQVVINNDEEWEPLSFLPPVESLMQTDGLLLTVDPTVGILESSMQGASPIHEIRKADETDDKVGLVNNTKNNGHSNATRDHQTPLSLPSPGLVTPRKGRKRGRPKSTRPVVPSLRNGPNLYSVISKASDLSFQQALARPNQNGMAPTDVFSGGAGIRPEGDSYAWMSEHRGKRRKSPTLTSTLLQATISPNCPVASPSFSNASNHDASSPLIDSLTADPALMVSLGMRPCENHLMGFTPTNLSSPLSVSTDLTFSPPPGSPRLSIPQLRRTTYNNNNNNNSTKSSAKSPLSTISVKSPGNSPPSEMYMNELFQELLQDHPE